MAGLFQVLWGKKDKTFGKAEILNGTDGQPLIPAASVGNGPGYDNIVDKICTRPWAVDWDHDGDLDLIVGNFAGTFCLFRGEGEGKFQPTSEILMVGNDVLRIDGHHGDPFCIDWDGDGDLDLLSGSTDGSVQWAENEAGKDKPAQLKKFTVLIPAGSIEGQGSMLKESDLTGPTRSTRIWVDDVNGDGKLDVLVGDSTTLASPAKGLTEEECKVKEAEWQTKMEEAQKKLQTVDDIKEPEKQQEIYAEYSKLYQTRSEFIAEERTGFVWLYLRK